MLVDTLLTIAVTILSIDQGVATLDRGRMAGLMPGDSGRIYYQLKVGPETKRIDVGEGTIIAVEDSSSRLRIDGEPMVRPSYIVEFEIPLSADPAWQSGDPALGPLIARLAQDDHELQRELVRAIRERRLSQTPEPPPSSNAEVELRAHIAELETARESRAELQRQLEDQRARLLRSEAARSNLESQLEKARAKLAEHLTQSDTKLLQQGSELEQAHAEIVLLTQRLEMAEAANQSLQAELAATLAESSPAPSPVSTRQDSLDNLPPQVPGDGSPQPAADSPRTEILKLIEHWAQAWSEQRIDDYLACYAKDFRTPEGLSRLDWEAQRRLRIQEPQFIEIELEGPEILSLGDDETAIVRFRQLYRSSSYNVAATKTLELVQENGHWRILAESIN